MINATGKIQRVALFGGTSEIGITTVTQLLAHGPAEVIVAARSTSPHLEGAIQSIEKAGGTVTVVDFDAADTASHPEVVDNVFAHGDVDVALVCFGVLGDAEQLWQDQDKAVQAAQVNYTGAVSIGVLLGQKMRAQGHGSIVALSSVAGVKVRRSNFVYGSTKAGFDGFYTQLGEALRGTGVHVVVVRPGQVRTKMTDGLDDAPLTVDPQQVATAICQAIESKHDVVWCHPLFKYVMMVLQHIPAPIMRKLPI